MDPCLSADNPAGAYSDFGHERVICSPRDGNSRDSVLRSKRAARPTCVPSFLAGREEKSASEGGPPPPPRGGPTLGVWEF